MGLSRAGHGARWMVHGFLVSRGEERAVEETVTGKRYDVISAFGNCLSSLCCFLFWCLGCGH